MHKKLMLLATLFLLLSACTPVVDTPTPAPIVVNTSTTTPSPSATLENTPTQIFTTTPRSSDNNIFINQDDIIDNCFELEDFDTAELTIDTYSFISFCTNDEEFFPVCEFSTKKGAITETYLFQNHHPFTPQDLTSPSGDWFGFIVYEENSKYLSIVSFDGTVLNPEGKKIENDQRVIGWLDNETLLIDEGPTDYMDSDLRTVYLYNPFRNVTEAMIVFLEKIDKVNLFPTISINHHFTKVFYFQTSVVEFPYNAVIKNIDTDEILWKGINQYYRVQPQWSMDDSYFAVQNLENDESLFVDYSHNTLVILDSEEKLIYTLWFNFVDVFDTMAIYWSPDNRYLSLFLRVGDVYGYNQLYLFDMETQQLINTCITNYSFPIMKWRPDSKGFTTLSTNKTTEGQLMYYDVTSNRGYLFPANIENFGWIRK
jgi:hypothetical protein